MNFGIEFTETKLVCVRIASKVEVIKKILNFGAKTLKLAPRLSKLQKSS